MCGTRGQIYATFNRFIKFKNQFSKTLETLNDIVFLDKHNGWCVGENGTILCTSDSGATWKSKTTAFTDHMNKVHFVTNEFGFIVGNNGLILKTSDGGNSWNDKESGTTVNLYNILFTNKELGFAVGDLGTILESTDGGESWKVYRKEYTHCFKDLYYEGFTKNIIIGGTEGFLKKFNPVTMTWSEMDFPLSKGINSFFFINKDLGWIVGNKGSIVFLQSNRFGDFFTTQSPISRNNINDVHFINLLYGVAVGDGETVWITENSGTLWKCYRNYFGQLNKYPPPPPRRPYFKVKQQLKRQNNYEIY